MSRLLFAGAIAAGTALVSPEASANCAMPTTYEVTVFPNNTVTICPMNYQGRGCPDPEGLLREGGGEIVKVADKCVDGRRPERCYVDDCVPAGEYKYGFATPYECCETCCGTDYYATAIVTSDPPTPCVSGGDGGEGGDDSGAGGVPWGDSYSICDYQGGSARGGTGGGGTGGLAGNDDGSPSTSDAGCSCATGSRFDPRELVFAANGLLVFVGLLLMRRRRHA
jgi:hypothetical protein